MPQQSRIFRVFISSTFTDMKPERGILQRDAFPRLEKFCEEKDAKFQAVDLRWGVNEESARDQKTLQICLNEVARCQKISPKPNFLILLGDKYGWQPVPEFIPKQERELIMSALNGENKVLFENWYKQDANALSEHFVLQPWEKLELKKVETQDELKEREYSNWKGTENALREILRNAIDNPSLLFTEEQKERYITSATHQEITMGALNPPDHLESPEKHVFAFSRKINVMPLDKTAKDFIDLDNNKPDENSKTKLNNLKYRLKDLLGECFIDQIPLKERKENEETIQEYELTGHYINYDAEWINNGIRLNDLQKFNDVVHDALKRVISDQLSAPIDKDELNHEINLHNDFKERLTKHFKGRNAILQTIQENLDKANENKVIALMGVSGSGKSSVMAKAVDLNEGKEAVIIYRFIGTTSGSTNIMSLLQSLCGQIATHYGIDDAKTLGMEGDEKAWYDLKGLTQIFYKCLEKAKPKKPLLVFLDSLDQLSDTDNAKALYWLPDKLPENARMVVSSLPIRELEQGLKKTDELQLLPLPVEDAKEILDAWLNDKEIERKLTNDQYAFIINSYSKTKLPLYLKLAFEKARKWHSYDSPHKLEDDIPGVINDYFKDLEYEYPQDFVKTAICYLLSGRYQGLTENEILEILAFDPEYWILFNWYRRLDRCC